MRYVCIYLNVFACLKVKQRVESTPEVFTAYPFRPLKYLGEEFESAEGKVKIKVAYI